MNHRHFPKGVKAIGRMALCLFAVNVLAPLVSGQSAPADERVTLIRQRYNSINGKLATYRRVKKNGIEIDSESAGNLNAYLAGKEIRKIGFLLDSESSRWSMEYYYWAGELIFVYQKKRQLNLETSRLAFTEERRLYFAAGKIIKLQIDQKDVPVNGATYDAQYKEQVDNTVELSKKLVARVRTR